MTDLEEQKDAGRPFYERKAGEIGIFIDIFDAQPANDEPIGSKQFFIKDLGERLCEQIQKQELFKVKGFFEKRNLLKDVTIEYINNERGSSLMIVCTNNAEAVMTTKKEYESGRLQRCTVECFGSETLQKRLGVKNLKMKVKIWEDEFESCVEEWSGGKMPEKYTLMKNAKTSKMLRHVKRYQHQKLGGENGIVALLRQAEFQYEQTFADFVLCIKKMRADPFIPVNSLTELQALHEQLKTSAPKEPEIKLIAHYLDTVALVSRLVREVETNVWFPLSQVRVGGENPRQSVQRALVRTLLSDVKMAVRTEFTLNGKNALRDAAWSAKITAAERRILDGVVCFLPVLIHKLLDVDQAIDDYLQEGSVVIKISELQIA